MTTLEVTFISILSKIDLLSKKSKKQLERWELITSTVFLN
jgi:hypothetical protein